MKRKIILKLLQIFCIHKWIRGAIYDSYYDYSGYHVIQYHCHCQKCGKRQGDINAHHLNGYHWYKEGRTDVNNGVTLCSCCHKEFHEIYNNRNNTKEQYEEWISK